MRIERTGAGLLVTRPWDVPATLVRCAFTGLAGWLLVELVALVVAPSSLHDLATRIGIFAVGGFVGTMAGLATASRQRMTVVVDLADLNKGELNLFKAGGISTERGNWQNGGLLPSLLSKGDIRNIEAIANGNFNSAENLSISEASEKSIDRFFENYFKSHIENMTLSKTQKVINSKEFYIE